MDPDIRAQIEKTLAISRRIVPEHQLEAAFARRRKSALRQADLFRKGILAGASAARKILTCRARRPGEGN